MSFNRQVFITDGEKLLGCSLVMYPSQDETRRPMHAVDR